MQVKDLKARLANMLTQLEGVDENLDVQIADKDWDDEGAPVAGATLYDLQLQGVSALCRVVDHNFNHLRLVYEI